MVTVKLKFVYENQEIFNQYFSILKFHLTGVNWSEHTMYAHVFHHHF